MIPWPFITWMNITVCMDEKRRSWGTMPPSCRSQETRQCAIILVRVWSRGPWNPEEGEVSWDWAFKFELWILWVPTYIRAPTFCWPINTLYKMIGWKTWSMKRKAMTDDYKRNKHLHGWNNIHPSIMILTPSTIHTPSVKYLVNWD